MFCPTRNTVPLRFAFRLSRRIHGRGVRRRASRVEAAGAAAAARSPPRLASSPFASRFAVALRDGSGDDAYAAPNGGGEWCGDAAVPVTSSRGGPPFGIRSRVVKHSSSFVSRAAATGARLSGVSGGVFDTGDGLEGDGDREFRASATVPSTAGVPSAAAVSGAASPASSSSRLARYARRAPYASAAHALRVRRVVQWREDTREHEGKARSGIDKRVGDVGTPLGGARWRRGKKSSR